MCKISAIIKFILWSDRKMQMTCWMKCIVFVIVDWCVILYYCAKELHLKESVGVNNTNFNKTQYD